MIRTADQSNDTPSLLTEAEAIKWLRLDVIAGERPDLALKRYRCRRGGYALKGVRICGCTLYRRSDLEAFVSALQERQDLSTALTETPRKGAKRYG